MNPCSRFATCIYTSLIVAFGHFSCTSAAPTDPKSDVSSWLSTHPLTAESLVELQQQPFASESLDRETAAQIRQLLWSSRSSHLLKTRAEEMKEQVITIGDNSMKFWFKAFGDAPKTGRRLFISMHGGGGAPSRVNDQQFENQKRLYQPVEGIYLVPRAPTDNWNLWHEAHIDEFFDRLITNMILFENVDPDRVYIMGYSAGGDGVYQLAPRMADRLAAASMMAGHPNETKPDGLRNLPFTIHMGARDGAYNRNRIAGEWKQKLKALHDDDTDGYTHSVTLHSGRAHWMNLDDAVAVPWMSEFQRNRFPDRIVWLQDDVTHRRFYWLQNPKHDTTGRARVVATLSEDTITIDESDVSELDILVNDEMLQLDNPVTILQGGKTLFEGRIPRTTATIAESLLERDDPKQVFCGQVNLNVTITAADAD